MSGLPNLSSGKNGVVDHTHMNRVLRATERVEAMAQADTGQKEQDRFPLLVRLTENDGGTGWIGYDTWEWEEIRAFKSGATFGVEKFGVDSSQWTPAAVAVAPIGLSPGQLAHLWPLPANFGHVGDGLRRMFLAVPLGSGAGTVTSGVILAQTEDRDPMTLGKPGYLVARHQDVSADLTTANGSAIFCINLPEISGQLQDQVQNESPGVKTLLRLPVGTVVGPISRMPSTELEIWCFTTPNAYGVVC